QEQLQPQQPPALPDLSDLSAERWTLEQGAAVKDWFKRTYGRELPVSAEGLDNYHKSIGLDHSEAMDVALHPDSAEGRALLSFLDEQHIPHLAFTHPQGNITGAHIHIGPTSHALGAPATDLPDLSDLAAGSNKLPDLSD